MKRRKYINESKHNNEEPFPPWGETERGVFNLIGETGKEGLFYHRNGKGGSIIP